MHYVQVAMFSDRDLNGCLIVHKITLAKYFVYVCIVLTCVHLQLTVLFQCFERKHSWNLNLTIICLLK